MADTHAHTVDTPLYEEGPPHPYHLVKPSPWPIIGAMAAGLMALGALAYMHDGPKWLFFVGLASVILVMALWWGDIIKESIKEKVHTPVVKIGLRYGMALFIASEVMFFVAFFWAFYNAAIWPKVVGADTTILAAVNPLGSWPPPQIKPIDAFHIPFTMTVILLLSGVTVTWAHHALIEGKRVEAGRALAVTILLGVLFTFFQAYEYTHAEFGFREGVFTSTFFMATGFHGFHVIIGTIFLIVAWYRTTAGHFTANSHFGFEAAAWYWHFVDVVWLFLFASIYWWGSVPRVPALS